MADTTPAPGKRDPEGRKQAILGAAAEILITQGVSGLTHRAVAGLAQVSLGSTTQYFSSIDDLRERALEMLARETESELADIASRIETSSDIPRVLARETAQFIRNERGVRTDIALISNGVTDPALRPLALMWTDRVIEILTPHIGEASATAAALYIDGALVHAGLHPQSPMSEETLRIAISALLKSH